MAATSKYEAYEESQEVIESWALRFAAVAWIPGSHYVMSAGDLAMVIELGGLWDINVNQTDAAAIFTLVAAPLIGSKIVHSVLDFIPGFGWVAKSAVAYGVTQAVGQSLISYFKNCSKLPNY